MPEFNRPSATPVQPRREMGQTGQGQAGTEFGDVMSNVQEKARQVAGQAQEYAQQAGQEAQRLASQAAERAEDAWEDVSGWVRRNPVPTLLIVAGVGALVALAFASASYASSSSNQRRW